MQYDEWRYLDDCLGHSQLTLSFSTCSRGLPEARTEFKVTVAMTVVSVNTGKLGAVLSAVLVFYESL